MTGPRVTPRWWNLLRQLLLFALGLFTILWAVLHNGVNVVILIVGLILLGLVPVELLIARFAGPPPAPPPS